MDCRFAGAVSGIGGASASLLATHAGRTGSRLLGPSDHAGALSVLLSTIAELVPTADLAAAGHRVVHGGTRYAAPARIDDRVLAELGDLVPLAPLHQPHNLAAIRLLRERLPALPQVACFDTSFHVGMPAVAQATGLPARHAGDELRRYGFHGLACEAVLAHLHDHFGAAAAGQRLVLAHLGSGASMTAVAGGRSVDTTMGFSTLDGLLMGTRCGDIDPGLLLYLLRNRVLEVATLEHMLYEESGLLGVSGRSAAMQDLLAHPGDAAAAAAIDLFCHRATKHAGALAAVLGGIDRLVFSGGIGEQAAPVRARICGSLAHLGVVLDADCNARSEAVISAAASRVVVHVVAADEQRIIAAHTLRALGRADWAAADPAAPAPSPRS